MIILQKVRNILSLFLALVLTMGVLVFPTSAAEKQSGYVEGIPGRIDMNIIGRYDVDTDSPEGGLEIVTYVKEIRLHMLLTAKTAFL
ncbi:hypothetical protein OXPF_29720 [Oxobacter pfennigii]|uniref:Uncharacterized protein n=1 Tax=Oxobacter pfennigii TaxID=36849 RepID=A0A0P8W4N0_9CLOT|nr:hypothetical protein [Oxobacter pfennigii]KPU43531.1 hypothetical protein OXPF_29720 [Oxobacter pfennigii]